MIVNNLTRSNDTIDLNLIVNADKSVYFTITFIGMMTNVLNILVLRSSRLKDRSFKYFLVIAIVDLIYLLIFNIDSLLKLTNLVHTYNEQLFQIVCVNYLTSSLATFVLLLDLVNSMDRCFICFNKYYLQNVSFRKMLVLLLIVSMITYWPELFSKRIVLKKNQINRFKLVSTSWGSSKACNMIVISVWAVRFFLTSAALTGINLISVVGFIRRNVYKSKTKLKKLGDLKDSILTLNNIFILICIWNR